MQQASMNPSHNPCISKRTWPIKPDSEKANKRYIPTYLFPSCYFFFPLWWKPRASPQAAAELRGEDCGYMCLFNTHHQLSETSIDLAQGQQDVLLRLFSNQAWNARISYHWPNLKGDFSVKSDFFMGTGWTKSYGHMLCTKYNNCTQFI